MKIEDGISFLKKNDKVIASLIKKHRRFDLKPGKDYFSALVEAIIYQQLHMKAAATIHKRFLEQVGKATPENVLKLRQGQFKKAGISPQKQRYLIDLADRFRHIDTKQFKRMNDDEIIAKLTEVKGIGRWTAEMFLIFTMNRLDVFPLDDLGIQKAIMISYKLKKMPTKEQMIKISEKWGEYKTIASWYLWRSLD